MRSASLRDASTESNHNESGDIANPFQTTPPPSNQETLETSWKHHLYFGDV
ncbi:MAG: hypothetical protein WA919_08650 [Coleofasciculaceae cyanobacterium]